MSGLNLIIEFVPRAARDLSPLAGAPSAATGIPVDGVDAQVLSERAHETEICLAILLGAVAV